MHSVCSFRLLCRVRCVWSSNRQNGLKNDKLTRHEDGHISTSIHKAETPSVSHGHGEIKQSMLLFHRTYKQPASGPNQVITIGVGKMNSGQERQNQNAAMKYPTAREFEFNPILAVMQTPAQARHCRFRRYGHGIFAAPAVNQLKKQQLDQCPGPRMAESDCQYYPHMRRSVRIPPSGLRPMCNDACMSIQ